MSSFEVATLLGFGLASLFFCIIAATKFQVKAFSLGESFLGIKFVRYWFNLILWLMMVFVGHGLIGVVFDNQVFKTIAAFMSILTFTLFLLTLFGAGVLYGINLIFGKRKGNQVFDGFFWILFSLFMATPVLAMILWLFCDSNDGLVCRTASYFGSIWGGVWNYLGEGNNFVKVWLVMSLIYFALSYARDRFKRR